MRSGVFILLAAYAATGGSRAIDGNTSCARINAVFEDENAAQIEAFDNFVARRMRELDAARVRHGEAGIMAEESETGMSNLVSFAAARCLGNSAWTLGHVVEDWYATYREFRMTIWHRDSDPWPRRDR